MKQLVFVGLLLLLACPGCSEDDSGLCGNNTIDPGETCDGNCPQSCDDQNACTIDTMFGRADNCDVECRHAALTGCFDADGCCPADCSSNNDDDCSSSCGNDELEEGETCDPPATCPADCDDDNDCTSDLMTGSAQNCNVDCSHAAIVLCDPGDGCCPQSCTSANDDDCGGGNGDCQFDPDAIFGVVAEILQMESVDGGTCVWLRRKNDCPPGWICKANPFTFEEIRIGHDGRVVEYDSSNADLSWSASWHNWEDVGTVDTGTTVYTLTGAEYGWAYSITASGGENWGPILLEPWEP